MTREEAPVTRWLERAAEGDRAAEEQVAEWAYAELERLAGARLQRSLRSGSVRAPLTLEPAALVNETFVKMLQNPQVFANRRHFFAFTSKVMLRVLIDHQRARAADKRGGETVRLVLDGLAAEGPEAVNVLVVRDVFERLEAEDPRKAEVARLRALWGLSVEEVAEVLDVSVPTVVRDWRFVRNWVAEHLELP